jgi:hypothetical protein
MKTVNTAFNCDVCGKPVDESLTVTNFAGRNFGLCPDCRKKGYTLERSTSPGGPGLMINIGHPAPQPEHYTPPHKPLIKEK